MQRHFAEVVRQVSVCPRGCLGVADGDVISGTRGGYSIVWPPRQVWSNDPYGRAMQDGVQAFRAAAEADRELREAYEMTADAELAAQYLPSVEHAGRPLNDDYTRARDDECDDDQDDVELPPEDDGERPADIEVYGTYEEELSPPVRRANQALRNVADLFSLAFHCNPHLLFLGDLKSREIHRVVTALCSGRGPVRYNVLVSAHHGTRWNRSLRNIFVRQAVVSSVGGRLRDLVCPEYDNFGVPHYLTCRDGHLALYL
ncbi:MAG TPA: hypothetical protein VMY98_00715 [Anaerolineae bacterium]|nr:hypothetical protein [Anaerolineae bacterium]